jgi:hypothetical protein
VAKVLSELLVNTGMAKGNHRTGASEDGAFKNSVSEDQLIGDDSKLGDDSKYDDRVQKLIEIGKEKGYLLYDEVNDLLPPDIGASGEDLAELFLAFGTAGIEVIATDDEQFAALDKVSNLKKFEGEAAEEGVELDLTPGVLDKANDPIRMYLREMGSVPLLTRAGEVEIAKRIERGQLTVLKVLSRSPVIAREIVALGERLKRDPGIIQDVLRFSEEELTDEKDTGKRLTSSNRSANRTRRSSSFAQSSTKPQNPRSGNIAARGGSWPVCASICRGLSGPSKCRIRKSCAGLA